MNAVLRVGQAAAQGLKTYGTQGCLLLTRAAVGYGFYATGKGKLAHLDRVGQWFESLGIPFPQFHAWFVAHLEFFGGILILVGLATRLVTLLLASTMVGALLTADRADFLLSWTSSSDDLPIDIAAFTYLLLLLWLLSQGGGRLSVDRLLSRIWSGGDKAKGAAPISQNGSLCPNSPLRSTSNDGVTI